MSCAAKCSSQATKCTSQNYNISAYAAKANPNVTPGHQLATHGKPNYHPRTKSAARRTPNSTPNAVMLQCNYGKKILGAGGRGISL